MIGLKVTRRLSSAALQRALMPTETHIGGPLKSRLDAEFVESEKALFDSESYGTWPQLSEPYRTQKAKKYPGRGILVRKGRLKASLTQRGHPDHVAKVGTKRTTKAAAGILVAPLIFGTKVPYARWHASGTKKMPRRDPIARRYEDVAAYKSIALDFIRNFVRKGISTLKRKGIF